MSVIGKFGIGAGDGVLGSDGNLFDGDVVKVVDGRAVVACAVTAAGFTRSEQLADGHQVIAVGLQHRDELIHQIDCAGIGVVEQHD